METWKEPRPKVVGMVLSTGWHGVKIWKKEKILVLLGLGQRVCFLVTGFTCTGGTSSPGYLCENITHTQ